MFLAGWLNSLVLMPAAAALGGLGYDEPADQTSRIVYDFQVQPDPAQVQVPHGQFRYRVAPGQTFQGQPGQFRFQGIPDQLQTLFAFVGEPVLGLTLQPVPEVLVAQLDLEEGSAQLVAEVAEGSAAAKAGVRKNDLLLAIGDQPAKEAQAVAEVIAKAEGKTIVLKLLRKGKEQEVEVELPAKPGGEGEAEQKYYIGVQVGELGEEVREQLEIDAELSGVVVLDVIEDSPAEEAEVQKNDIVVRVEDKEVKEAGDLVNIVQEAGEEPIELKLIRKGEEIELTVTPRPRPDEFNVVVDVEGQPLQRDFQVFGPGVMVGRGVPGGFQVQGQPLPGAPGQPPVLLWQAQQASGDLAKQVESLAKQVEDLKALVEELKKDRPRRRPEN